MTAFARKMLSYLYHGIIRSQKERIRRELLQRSDRSLADLGFSRYKLEQGVSAWPWREQSGDADVNVAVNTSAAQLAYRQAVKELHGYSDAELADLGIARSNIEQAVRNGRPGIDHAADQPRRQAA